MVRAKNRDSHLDNKKNILLQSAHTKENLKMIITLEYLRSKDACSDGIQWFTKNFPDGGDYQAVLDALAAEGQHDYANWLLDHAGSLDTILEIESFNGEWLFFAGTIKVKAGIEAKKAIRAGRAISAGRAIRAGWEIRAGRAISAGYEIRAGRAISAGEEIRAGWEIRAGRAISAGRAIRAGEEIRAGWEISAGEEIRAGWEISAGEDYEIFAGIRVRLSDKEAYALIVAKTKPKNIGAGIFQKAKEVTA
jgi:hypothetical protein